MVPFAAVLYSLLAFQPTRWWESARIITREDQPGMDAAIEASRPSARRDSLTAEFVSFDDIIAALPDRYDVQTSWDCIGHQPNSTFIYVCYTTWKNTDVRTLFSNQDTLVFRYDIASGNRAWTCVQIPAKTCARACVWACMDPCVDMRIV